MKNGEMDRLAVLNRLTLTETERDTVQAFFEDRLRDRMALERIDTDGVGMTVHVMPVPNALREDVVEHTYSREGLQADAPAVDGGYWCVPRVIE